MPTYDKIVIGVDQSYSRTGLSIVADGKLMKVSSTNFKGCTNKSQKRKHLANLLTNIIEANKHKASEVVILCERIRTFSHGGGVQGKAHKDEGSGMFISTSYIRATGALVATIVDTAYEHGIPVYSVDTRSWKSKIVGTSKKQKGDPKIATINHVISLGFGDSISGTNKKWDTVYNDDAADSACIALYGFLPESQQVLNKEE